MAGFNEVLLVVSLVRGGLAGGRFWGRLDEMVGCNGVLLRSELAVRGNCEMGDGAD